MVKEAEGRLVIAQSGRRVNLLKVARVQRTLTLLVGVAVLVYGSMVLSTVSGALAQFGVVPIAVLAVFNLVLCVLAVVQTVRLPIASGANVGLAIIGGFLMFIPLIGLLLFLRQVRWLPSSSRTTACRRGCWV